MFDRSLKEIELNYKRATVHAALSYSRSRTANLWLSNTTFFMKSH